jgi:hypothetical protein
MISLKQSSILLQAEGANLKEKHFITIVVKVLIYGKI